MRERLWKNWHTVRIYIMTLNKIFLSSNNIFISIMINKKQLKSSSFVYDVSMSPMRSFLLYWSHFFWSNMSQNDIFFLYYLQGHIWYVLTLSSLNSRWGSCFLIGPKCLLYSINCMIHTYWKFLFSIYYYLGVLLIYLL